MKNKILFCFYLLDTVLLFALSKKATKEIQVSITKFKSEAIGALFCSTVTIESVNQTFNPVFLTFQKKSKSPFGVLNEMKGYGKNHFLGLSFGNIVIIETYSFYNLIIK